MEEKYPLLNYPQVNNIHPIFDKILKKEDKESLLKQKGAVLWMVGLSGSGKSTLAKAVEQQLHEQGYLTQLLDGDNLRTGINNNLDDRACGNKSYHASYVSPWNNTDRKTAGVNFRELVTEMPVFQYNVENNTEDNSWDCQYNKWTTPG